MKDSPEGKKVLDYLLSRGISEEILKEFEIGFAPSGWANLKDYFVKLEQQELIKNEIGLFKKNEKNNIYDVFRNRIIFPLNQRKKDMLLDLEEEL